MKKGITLILAAMMALSMTACASTTTPSDPASSPAADEEKTETKQAKDGSYTAYMTYYEHPAYLVRATVTVQDGKATDYSFEECHLPDHWATLTEEEIAGLDASDYVKGTLVTGTETYFGTHVQLGEGDEAMILTGTGGGDTMPVYSNEEIADFSLAVGEDETLAAWYFEQLANGSYWILDKDGNKLEGLKTYELDRKDGVHLDKTESRFKTLIGHWTAEGTGYGIESGSLGWSGNLKAIGDFCIENQFPEGEFGRTEDNVGTVGDTVTGATATEYENYIGMFYDAWHKAFE